MQPALGMFLSHDPWSGNALQPGSMNGWNYVEGNPVNRTDPTGRIVDPLTTQQWRLAKQEVRRFQIPTELAAGTLAAEIVYDTDWYDYWMDIYLLKLPLIVAYCPDSSNVDKRTAMLWLDWYYHTEFAGPGLGPGPGLAQIHVKTAEDAENWFNTHYPGQGFLEIPPNLDVRLAILLTDEGNIRYAAAILRQLADLRTNRLEPHLYEPAPKSNHANLTDLDMQVIYEAYQAGIHVYDDEPGRYPFTSNPKTYGPRILPYLSYYRQKG